MAALAHWRRLAGAALAVLAAAPAPASARVVEFPIQLDLAFVRQRMVETLFDGANESTRVWHDTSQCNDVSLAHPRLSAREGKLHVVADFDAKLGAPVGNWCLNATRRKGIMDAALEARLHPTLPIVEFRVASSELLDADGQKRITGAIWEWVRSQVHPQLETIRIDLFQPMSELKTFLPVVFPGSDVERVKQLIASLKLQDVVVAEQGITLRVRLDVPDPAKPAQPAPPRPEVPLTPEELARWDSAWQSWDGFLTFLVKHSSKDAGDALRDQLRALLLDAREDMSEILASDAPRTGNPVRPLFLQTWTRLAPILRQISTPLPGESALHYLSLITAADAFTALEQLGPDYGVDLTTDGLRRMARMIEPSPFADPTAYTDAVDNELRELFGFGPPLEEPEEEEMAPGAEAEPHAAPEHAPAPEAAPAPAEPAPPTPAEPTAPAAPPAPAPGPPQSSLDRAPFAVLLVAGKPRSLENWIPSREELLEYLPRVGDLLGTTALRTQRKKVLAGSYATLFRNLVLTTAWQESCWRQFVRKGGAVQPLTSSVGAVGIMQVNPHVWRGFYDVNALRSSTKYNAEAGSEILHHYLVDYAIKQHEDLVRKNPDDLARATYAAYNAGPRQLDRYRRPFPKGKTGHRIDEDFWEKYQQIKKGDDLAVKSCFPGLET
ncbi:MAG: lytic transglycosylase domain-containing protein [Deltaproteobacteria bacterium]|nr:MAG: lytic transglycosylase domain-containing protein [Deltaproteobacteria bacterium]